MGCFLKAALFASLSPRRICAPFKTDDVLGAAQLHRNMSFDLMPDQYHCYQSAVTNNEVRIAYRYFAPTKSDGRDYSTESEASPQIVMFLNGLLSNMSGTKTRSIQQRANDRGAGFVCFDYRGHGSSSGDLVDCTIHDWMEDARSLLDHVLMQLVSGGDRRTTIQPEVILVGSSLGAWIALHLAMEYQELVTGVIGVGSAFDFTESAFHKLTEAQKKVLSSCAQGSNPTVDIRSPYLDEPFPFSRALYESGKDYLLCSNQSRDGDTGRCFRKGTNLPVRFLHGSEDDVVHWSTVAHAMKFLETKYQCDNVDMMVLDGGDHRLSRPSDISVLLGTISQMLEGSSSN